MHGALCGLLVWGTDRGTNGCRYAVVRSMRWKSAGPPLSSAYPKGRSDEPKQGELVIASRFSGGLKSSIPADRFQSLGNRRGDARGSPIRWYITSTAQRMRPGGHLVLSCNGRRLGLLRLRKRARRLCTRVRATRHRHDRADLQSVLWETWTARMIDCPRIQHVRPSLGRPSCDRLGVIRPETHRKPSIAARERRTWLR